MAGCSKKALLAQSNIIKEFRYVDMDGDDSIGLEDMRKFVMSYSDASPTEEGAFENMMETIIDAYSP